MEGRKDGRASGQASSRADGRTEGWATGQASSQCVCNQLFIDRYMWPEGPWQRLAAALADSSGVLLDHILSQI